MLGSTHLRREVEYVQMISWRRCAYACVRDSTVWRRREVRKKSAVSQWESGMIKPEQPLELSFVTAGAPLCMSASHVDLPESFHAAARDSKQALFSFCCFSNCCTSSASEIPPPSPHTLHPSSSSRPHPLHPHSVRIALLSYLVSHRSRPPHPSISGVTAE
jgi:hypothetical protein